MCLYWDLNGGFCRVLLDQLDLQDLLVLMEPRLEYCLSLPTLIWVKYMSTGSIASL